MPATALRVSDMALHTASTMKGIKDHRNTLKIKSKISNKSVDPFALTILLLGSDRISVYEERRRVVGISSRRDFSRFDLARGGPNLATLVRPRSEDLFAKRSSVTGKTPGLAALVGHQGRWVSLAGLVPICPRGHVSRFDPKVPHFSVY